MIACFIAHQQENACFVHISFLWWAHLSKTFFCLFLLNSILEQAVCGSCCMLGRIQTLYLNESVTCCGMGHQGWCLCLISLPIKLLEPLGGCVWFALNSGNLRRQVVEKYRIKDEARCCCCRLTPCCLGEQRFIVFSFGMSYYFCHYQVFCILAVYFKS